MYTKEKISEIEQNLRDRGIKYCIGAYVDIHGVPKAKVVPLDHLHHMAAGSERFTGYALDPINSLLNEFLPDVASRVHIRIIFVQRILNNIASSNGVSGLP